LYSSYFLANPVAVTGLAFFLITHVNTGEASGCWWGDFAGICGGFWSIHVVNVRQVESHGK